MLRLDIAVITILLAKNRGTLSVNLSVKLDRVKKDVVECIFEVLLAVSRVCEIWRQALGGFVDEFTNVTRKNSRVGAEEEVRGSCAPLVVFAKLPFVFLPGGLRYEGS